MKTVTVEAFLKYAGRNGFMKNVVNLDNAST